jgi:hypothetical protein
MTTPAENMQAAIAMLEAAGDSPAEAPAAPAPEAPAEAAPPPTTTETPPASAPADETAELIKLLDERKAKREQAPQSQAIDPAKLRAELRQEILAELGTLRSPAFADLVREHGHVEALKRSGLDPLEFFHGVKEVAKDPGLVQRQKNEAALLERISQLEQKLEGQGKTWEQVQAEQKQRAEAEQWNAYVQHVASPESGTPLLGKLPPHERVKRTQETIAWLHENHYDVNQVDDGQLAKLTEGRLRQLRDLLAGTDAGAAQRTSVPTTDGAKQPATASLTNDLASQSTSTRPMTERERIAAATAMLAKEMAG